MSKYSEGLAGQTVPYIEDDGHPIPGICEMPACLLKSQSRRYVKQGNKKPNPRNPKK